MMGEPGATVIAPALANAHRRCIDMAERTCSVEGCERRHDAQGFCGAHYMQWKRGKPFTPPSTRSGGTCAIDGCERRPDCYGICKLHDQRERRGRPINAPVRRIRDHRARLVRDDHGRKHCPDCDRWLAESDFGIRRAAQDQLQTHCRTCTVYRTQRRVYGITPNQFNALLDSQDGGCAACHRVLDPGQWCIDHDHACCPGKGSCGRCIRGVLCIPCNSTLGFARDDPHLLRALADYLERSIA